MNIETARSDQGALEALQPAARSMEDITQLAEWQDEINDRRTEAGRLMGERIAPTHIEVQGVVEPAYRVQVERDAGHEVSPNAYGPSGRHS